MNPEFQTRRAAQVAAWFALRQGGRINVLKLTKLLYLSERRHLDLYDEPMTYDRLVSMDHGPVPSICLNLMNGTLEHPDWAEFITDRDSYDLGVVGEKTNPEQFDQLSRADHRLLEEIWAQFGHMSKYELRDYTHEACHEWEDPDGSSLPIPYERVLKFLGKSDVEGLVADIKGWASTQRALAACE